MAKMQVMGFKHSKGDFNGQAYDYVMIYTKAKMQQKETQRGYAGIEIRGEPQLMEKLKKINFGPDPVLCEVETETIATGKGAFVEMVVDIMPSAVSVSAQTKV